MAKKVKQYNEAELIKMFNLMRSVGNHKHPLIQELTDCTATLNAGEQYLFDDTFQDLVGRKNRWLE